MSAHAGTTPEWVQAELMLPHEIEAALAIRSVAYLPLGSIEYHGRHLPIGLDGLNAHGICVHAAAHTGGIVLPPLWFGTGGTHTTHPWTIMSDPPPLRALLQNALQRLDDFGIDLLVLFTGHFADEQLDLIDTTAQQWNDDNHRSHAMALSVNRTKAAIPPDHAGVFETTLLAALWPERVDLARLPDLTEIAADGPVDGGWGHRDDPQHPLWGVVGPDPRSSDLALADRLLDQIVAWTTAQVSNAPVG